ncbi:MAG: hypothetical protein ACC645_18740, partial [Pirellulales bacterium]
MSFRFIGCLALLTSTCGVGVSVRAETASPWKRFADEPAGTLIRRLEPAVEPSTTARPAGPDTAEGLVVRQQHRWAPESRVLVIDSQLVNTGQTTATVGRVSVADWRFRVADGQDGARYRSLTYRSDIWYGSTYWTGPGWTRVGKDWHHPGSNTPSVRRFEAPRDGRVEITGRVYKADTNQGGGDGVRLSIRHGTRTVWEAELDGDDAAGVEPHVTLELRKGDAIRFVVHKRGQITCDTTHWDPVVTYTGGPRYQASAGFTKHQQGDGGWFYEMEVDADDTTRLPSVHAFGLDAVPRDRTPTVGRSIGLTHHDALPLFV